MRRVPSLRFGPDPLSLSDDTVDRLLGGLPASDAPPSYARVADLLAGARLEAATTVVGVGGGIVAAMAAEVTAASSVVDLRARPNRRKPMLSKLLSMKFAALTAGGVLAASGMAAAATGALPASVQNAVAGAADTVGVSLPTSSSSSTSSTSSTSSSSDSGTTATGGTAGATVTCPADVKNHGQFVSSVAHAGGDVSAAAQSDCGKKHDGTEATENEHETSTTEADHDADEHETEKPEAPEAEHHASSGPSSHAGSSAKKGKNDGAPTASSGSDDGDHGGSTTTDDSHTDTDSHSGS